MSLGWQASTDNVGVVGYRVYRGSAHVGTVSTAVYQDSGLSPSTSYSYTVVAYDAAGNASSPSAVAQVTTSAAATNVIAANPTNYVSLLATLKPGDILELSPGNYGADANGNDNGSARGLPISNLNGTSTQPITIKGPDGGPKPVIWASQAASFNVIQFRNSSHIVVKGVEVNGRNNGSFGVAASGTVHNITLEGLYIHDVGGDQQNVGISTTGAFTWNWVIRRNVIDGAGTGMYLGSSTGGSPFVAGLIEYNVVKNSIGYNVQVKHQNTWSSPPAGVPTGPTMTTIRHNVFSKLSSFVSPDGPRPNLLVGAPPPSGPGADNGFEVYGNFFWQNPTEALFQGEGNVALYSNLMVNASGTAVRIQRHNGDVRTVRIFNNTIVASATGISLSGGQAGTTQRVSGNAVFAATPISLSGADTAQSDNVSDSYANAAAYLNNPNGALGTLDLFPKPGQLSGTAMSTSGITGYRDYDRDFNGTSRVWTLRGAYSGQGVNPGWRPALEIKP